MSHDGIRTWSEFTATVDKNPLAAALRAAGYGDPLLPMPGTRWVDKDASWLPAGHRRVVQLRTVSKTITGWQARLDSYLVDADDKTVGGPLHGIVYLDHLLDWYTPAE